MASMNNWLGFSLSPQELPTQSDHHHHQGTAASRLGYHSVDISGNDVSGECFDLTSDSTPSINLPPSFGILEAFRANQPHDWNVKMLDINYRTTSSDLPMLCNTTTTAQNQEPKLENFLGGHAVSSSIAPGKYNMFQNCSNLQQNTSAADQNNNNDRMSNNNGGDGGEDNTSSSIDINNNNNSIGLSMIKTWLRNQPAAPPAQHPRQQQRDSFAGGAAQGCLSLSMSTGSHSAGGGDQSSSSDNNKHHKITTSSSDHLNGQNGAIVEAAPKKSIDTFGQRTSIYRGVTRHRWTGRYEAHLWDNSCRREGQTRKGRQVYLGGYDKEEKAARAYDLAALKYWGTTTTTNFPISNYEQELEEMKHMTRQEFVASLRRKSSGFSRGASIYRGVTRHHQHGRWQARIGRVAGNKDLYLGTFSTQEEAAEAYDIAAIKFRGLNAVTNFDMGRYDVKSILESSTLPIGGAAKRLKDVEHEMSLDTQRTDDADSITSQFTNGIGNYGAGAGAARGWPGVAFQQAAAQPFSMHYSNYGQRLWCKQEQESDSSYHHHQQLQLGNGTHNFFQASVLQNLMSMDSSSMEHSSGSNSVMYSSGGGDGNAGGYGFGIPMATVIANDHGSSQNHHQGNNGGFGDGGEVNMTFGLSSDIPYHARNLLYYQSSAGGAGMVKANAYHDHHQGSACNNWVPTAVPTLAPRTNNMAVCHGAPTFTVWNDT